MSQSGPVGRNFFNETRFQVRHQTSESVFAHRRADAAGARRLHLRRRANRGRPPRHRHRARDRSRLRQGPPLGARRLPARSRPLSQRRCPQHGRDVHVREPRRLRRRTADDVHAAQRQPARRVFAGAVRRLHSGRRARGAKPVDELRPSLRGPDAHRRLPELRAALRNDLVAVQERRDDDPRRRRHLLRVVRLADLRADAARGRNAADRPGRAEPRFPGSLRRRRCRRAAVEPLSAGRRT